jgi:hypothetical protein
MLWGVVVVAAALAAELHHAGARLDVGAVGVVGHVGHADKRMVQSLVWCYTTFLKIKKMVLNLKMD